MSRIRTKITAAVVAAGLVGSLTACAGEQQQSQPEYGRICVNQQHERVAGDKCGTDSAGIGTGFLWWYVLYGSTIPRYGQPVTSGVQNLPRTSGYVPLEKAPAGKSYTKPTSTYKAPAPVKPVAPKPAPKPAPAPAPKAPVYKAPAPVYKAPAPVYRAPTTPKFGK